MRPGFRAWVVQNEMPTGVIGHGQSRLVEDEFTRVGMAKAFTDCMWGPTSWRCHSSRKSGLTALRS